MSINFDLAASEDGNTKPVPSEALDDGIIKIWGQTDSEELPFVVTIAENEEHFSTIDEALKAAAAADGAVITLSVGQEVPAGFVMDEATRALAAAKYIVISPSSYVDAWTTYVNTRKEMPVAKGITFGVKNANEIYASDVFKAVADAHDGTPRNDAESIHKWIGMMQKLGTQYFVLGSNWRGIGDQTLPYATSDRATIIPGISAHPTHVSTTFTPLDERSSDLYYACHYKAEGQDYVWDPNRDGVYMGFHEASADKMADKRHYTPSCVVSRMAFYLGSEAKGDVRTYEACLTGYIEKLKRGEDEAFAGNDRYVAWTAQCKTFREDVLPDVYDVMSARLNSINTKRGAKELLHLVYLGQEASVEHPDEAQPMTEDLLAENKTSFYGNSWELFLPFGHGTPDGFAGLETEEFATNKGLVKFFVGGIRCLTGSLTALGNAATMALANPNGGSLVSINNASFGYLTEAGINQRYCGLSDELVDRCLDAYVGGATAGYAWKTAIARFADTMFSEDGLKGEEAAQRGYDDSENIPYIYAALVQQNLFGDPLVKIQTESKTTIAATVNRTARDHGFAADEFANALTEFAKDDALTMTVSNTCGSDATAITVPAGKTLTVNLNTTLTAENVTVAGTLTGAGSINGNLAFAENATLDASKPNKIRVAAGKTIATTGTGLNILLAEGTPVPAVKTLPVLEQSGCSVTGLAVKSVTSGGKTLTGPFELVGERDKLFLTHDAVVALYSEKNTSDKGAVVLSVYVTSETGVETLLAKSGSGEQYWQIPTGSKVKVTYGPDASHSGDTNTIVLNAVYATKDITDLIVAYENERNPTTIFWDAGSATYTGDMNGHMHMPDPYTGEERIVFVDTKIVDGDTIVFDPQANDFGTVQHNVSLTEFIPVKGDAKGAELHIDVDLKMTALDADDPIFNGKRVSIQSGKTLTLKPTATNLTMGDVEFNGGSLVLTTDDAAKVAKIDEIKGTTPIDLRYPLKVQPKTAEAPVVISGRITGNGTIDAPVKIHAGARILVSGTEYLTFTGSFTTKADVEADGYHCLTVDAMATKESLQKDSDGTYRHPIFKLASKAEAEAAIAHIALVEPEVEINGRLVNFELKADETGLVYMTELTFVAKEGFFQDGILARGNEVVWAYNSAFQDGVTSIQAACPAAIRFDFTGAGIGTTITADKPIVLTDGNELLFDVPEGRTVYVNCEISGPAGIRKTGKGTLVFGLPAGVEEGVSPNEAGWNTFRGALVIEDGLVRSTKAHGYGTRHTLSDGEIDPPPIDIHFGATLDLGHICDQDHLEIISAGTITNSVHEVQNASVGKIQRLTLQGDTTVSGHTFGMAHSSIIDLQGHVLTILMERGSCVVGDDGVRTEVYDHAFELDNTTFLGGCDNLDTPDIVVVQGTLSCEGSVYDSATDALTMGENNLGNASLKVCAEACLCLNANLKVRRVEFVNGNSPVTVPCDNIAAGETEPHTHVFPKVCEESAKPGAQDMTAKDDQYFGHIIILYQLKGGITAPRITFGAEDIYPLPISLAAQGIYDPRVQTIMLNKGEYIECSEQLTLHGAPFNAIFFDWDGQSGVRRLFHGWNKFAAEDRPLSAIITPFAYIKTGEGQMDYELVTCDWYPWGAYAEKDRPVDVRNTNPLADSDWAYAIPLWNPPPSQGENVIIATIKKFDGQNIYVDNRLNESVLIVTNGLLRTECPRGDNAMDFVIGTDWLKEHYPEWSTYQPGQAAVSDWLDEKGANGIERWQSYMLGLDPSKADSLPVLAVRRDTAPSFVKNGKTYVNVTVAGVDCYGYQYISPIYAIEELAIGADGKPITATSETSAVTPWQTEKHFQVPVPTDGHVKYFRVKVSFQGDDGITN